ncbi:MAG TPA: twin-arginine translocase subunit TatC [Candidatus Limnocylindrales bacterium]|nr:twin-arginine translocase subunit TatC [Candidatus Limnocylindrales bacterium]
MTNADALREGDLPTGVPSPSSDPSAVTIEDDRVMTLVDHLGELRTRLVRSLIAVGIGSIVGFFFSTPIIATLAAPAGGKLLNLGPGDAFAITLRVSLVTGVVLAMPVLLHQGWAFVAPGLTPAERRTLRPWIPLALLFFVVGVTIAYFVLPFAMGFLLSFGTGVFINQLAAGQYFDFVTTLFLAFGLLMEFPILLYALSRVGIVTSERLRASRRMIILGITIFATVATPGGDLVSPTVLGLTMYLLFELTLIAIRRSGR